MKHFWPALPKCVIRRCSLVPLLLLGVVAPCHAVPLLDQSFTTPSNLGGVINECCAFIAQTYTAGLSGALVGVNIDVQSSSSFPLHVAVRRVTRGVPNALLLGETTLSSSSAPLSLLITFPEEIEQVGGAQYAICGELCRCAAARPRAIPRRMDRSDRQLLFRWGAVCEPRRNVLVSARPQ